MNFFSDLEEFNNIQYGEKIPLSDKQKELAKILAPKIVISNQDDFTKILGESRLTKKQLLKLYFFSIEQINNTLRSDFKSHEEIKYLDYKKFVSKHPEINIDLAIKTFFPPASDTILKWTFKWEYGYQDSKLCLNEKMYYLRFYDF